MSPDDADDSKRRWFRIRVTVLSLILLGVLLYAWRDLRSRNLRSDWRRTLRIGLVLVPTEPLDEDAVIALKERTLQLEARLAEEMARYRQGPRPFAFFVAEAPYGVAAPPPKPPLDPSDLVGVVQFNWDLSRWSDRVDEGARLSGPRDATIYLVAKNGRELLSVEGMGEQGGRIGVVAIDLHESMVDVALFVVAHELFHILGASDKYAPDGSILLPDGLADPEAGYPQERAELMARHRAISETDSIMPRDLDELAIGPATAREIAWLP